MPTIDHAPAEARRRRGRTAGSPRRRRSAAGGCWRRRASVTGRSVRAADAAEQPLVLDRSRSRRGSTGCSAAAATPASTSPPQHAVACGSPPRRTPSSVGSYLQRGRQQRRDQRAGRAGSARARARAAARIIALASSARPPALPTQPRGAPRATPSSPRSRRQLAGVGARDEHEVVAAGQLVGRRPERLAQQPLHPVALDRAADLAADRHAEPRRRGRGASGARERVDDEVAGRARAPLAVDAVELRAAGEPAALAGGASAARRPAPARRASPTA